MKGDAGVVPHLAVASLRETCPGARFVGVRRHPIPTVRDDLKHRAEGGGLRDAPSQVEMKRLLGREGSGPFSSTPHHK